MNNSILKGRFVSVSVASTVLVLTAISLIFSAGDANAQAANVDVCHCEGGSCSTLNVAQAAVDAAHLNIHEDDYLGPCLTELEEEWIFCAEENGTVDVTGLTEVRYGAEGVYFYQTVSGDIACSNAQFGDPIEGTLKHCDCRGLPEPSDDSATIIATKIVCDSESDLPDRGLSGGAPDIDADTAEEFLENHPDCHLAAGREFQRGEDVDSPDVVYGYAGAGWNTTEPTDINGQTSFEVEPSDMIVAVREVLQEGYITYGLINPDEPSAELYCNTDGFNHDNYDYVGAVEAGETYYCIAFNAPNTAPGGGDICEFEEDEGWYGEYYNYLASHPDMGLPQEEWPDATHGDPLSFEMSWDTDRYDGRYFVFAQVDPALDFGADFFPLDGTAWEVELNGNNHEHHFGVHWSAQTMITSADTYDFTYTSDDDIRVYIDGELVSDSPGIHPFTTVNFSEFLDVGVHTFDIYFADRHIVQSHLSFTSLDQLTFVPFNDDCDEDEEPVCLPDVQLISNGGFETPVVEGAWALYPDGTAGLDWNVDRVNVVGAPVNANLELQKSLRSSLLGSQYAELDGGWSTDGGEGSVEIYQDIETIPGEEYTLSFNFSPRPGTDLSENILEVYRDGSLVDIISADGSANSDTDWDAYSYTLEAGDSSTRVMLRDGGTNNSVGTFVDNVNLVCGPGGIIIDPPEDTATIVATKIVCDDESDLPNWGGSESGAPDITASTVEDFLEEHPDCEVASGRQFEWAPSDADSPNVVYGYAGDPWTTSAVTDVNGSVEIEVPAPSSSIWVREVLMSGYQIFGNINFDIPSAELYCHTDGFNHDNYDGVGNVTSGATYYCVAFNTLVDTGANECEIPEIDSDEYALAAEFCEEFEASSIEFEACIEAYFCDGLCPYEATEMYSVYALDNSLNEGVNLDTIMIHEGDHIVITVDESDTRSAGPSDDPFDREGNADGLLAYGNYTDPVTLQEFPYGSLIGQIDDGPYFFIGTYFSGSFTETGVLELLYWDSVSSDNEGFVVATITVHGEELCDEEDDPVCGDGEVNQLSEECDDGNNISEDGCSASCQDEEPVGDDDPVCGNDILEDGEACDDGNVDIGDGCSDSCAIEVCGDGFVDINGADNNFETTEDNEACDDGNTENGDGCSATCSIEICIDTETFTLEVFSTTHSFDATPLVTSIEVESGDLLNISADPTDLRAAGPDDRTSNAGGLDAGNIYGGNYGYYTNASGSFPYGSLVGRIGTNAYFFIGTSYVATASVSGMLELVYWDSGSEDNSGSITVDVFVESAVLCEVPAFCGDGVVDEGEECDDGNGINTDDCTNTCQDNESSGGGGGGGNASSIDEDDGPSELLDTGGDDDDDNRGGSSSRSDSDDDDDDFAFDFGGDEGVTSSPLVFGPAQPNQFAFQLPVMLAETGAELSEIDTKTNAIFRIILLAISSIGIVGFEVTRKLTK